MNTNNTQTGAGNTTAAQILNNLTLAQAYAHAATTDKAAYIVELLGVKSIHSPLFVEMEDAIEERFHQLRVADNRNGWHKIPAAQPIDAAHAIYCDHDFNKGPLVCYVHDIREAALIAEVLGENPLDIQHALDMRAVIAALETDA